MFPPIRFLTLDFANLVFAATLIFCGLGVFISLWRIGNVIAESAAIRLNAAALISGDYLPLEKKKNITRIKHRGLGLRVKVWLYTALLVFAVVAVMALPLYRRTIESHKKTLLQSLWDRSEVLLEGLAANTRIYLPQRNLQALNSLPGQMNSIYEVQSVTITGDNPATPFFDDLVWATNDPNILQKIDTQEILLGVSRLGDALSLQLHTIVTEINNQALERVGGLLQIIADLYNEIRELTEPMEGDTPIDTQGLEQIQLKLRNYENMLNDTLSGISAIRSEPENFLDNFTITPDHQYIFYKPILYSSGSEDYFFQGLVRLEVSIDTILDDIDSEKQHLFVVILVNWLAAQAFGLIGAMVISTFLIRPIRQLAQHIEIIRDTEDKSKLAGVDIRIKSNDEFGFLGDTINDVTHRLVKAALADWDLSIGKEVQKKFLPLEHDGKGDKLSSGFEETMYLNLFAYYEGAKGVSGDYFDYQDLDSRYYAFIKCDVAGKGIPAAFVMIQVATMYLNYFKQWTPTEENMHIETLVYQINEFIEALGFKGRFAAFTLCLYDSLTGIMRFCNAGDNIVRIFDASEGRVKTISLPQTPAVGIFPNMMVESVGGYKVQTKTLDHGDILLLYTDGIEEAKRKFRSPEFEEITCNEGKIGTFHENHTPGQGDEELGNRRVQDIINTVMNRGVYTLHKWHNPEGDDKDLHFDFSTCQGATEDVIMAMVSVEKMFRCYKDPNATKDDQILVDKKIDAFLKEHFLQYRNYCSFVQEIPENEGYMYYTHIREDEQYDDLTILGIKRK